MLIFGKRGSTPLSSVGYVKILMTVGLLHISFSLMRWLRLINVMKYVLKN